MAILKRRDPRRFFRRMREALWPTMGWLRAYNYYRHRLFRRGDSTYRITAGLASGVAVSFTPFLGTHSGQGILLAWLLRSSMLAGWAGTIFGNPTTFPFIFWLTYKVGIFFCGLMGLDAYTALPNDAALGHYLKHPMEFLTLLWKHPWQLLLPLTIGGYLVAFIAWPLSYFALYYPVKGAQHTYRLQRDLRLKLKRAKEAARDSGDGE